MPSEAGGRGGVAAARNDPSDCSTSAPMRDGKLRPSRLDGMLGFHLRLAQEASFAAFARRAGDSGLRAGHFAALTIISENPRLTQTALSQAMGRDKSTLTLKLRELERRGLIQREPTPGDRRSYAIRLTIAGGRTLKALTSHASAHDRLLDHLVGDENRQSFLEALRRLVAGLDGNET